jgi:hypothetical protein
MVIASEGDDALLVLPSGSTTNIVSSLLTKTSENYIIVLQIC